ncbi:MAG TPA: hypothetical protein VMW63_08895 [Methanoregulaceae archaeon]|nr:hypothetical protein [Methanoregulaceae archaeon]
MTRIDLLVIDNTGAYIAGWLQYIQNGSVADVVRAAGDAQRAADLLLGAEG